MEAGNNAALCAEERLFAEIIPIEEPLLFYLCRNQTGINRCGKMLDLSQEDREAPMA